MELVKEPRTEIKPFPLTQYFVITSFLTTLVIAIVTAVVTAQRVKVDLLVKAKDHAVNVIHHLQKDILEKYIQPLLDRSEPVDLHQEEQFQLLDGLVRQVAQSFQIRDLYIFDRDGYILYSTQRDHVDARVPPTNDLFFTALEGRITWAEKDRGAPLDVGEAGATTALLETYVPVSSFGGTGIPGGTVNNVIETYQDLDEVQVQIRDSQRWVAGYTLAGSGALFLVLLWIVRRAHHLIHERSLELVRSNKRLRDLSQHLEEEVEHRTLELLQKEKLASLGTLAAGLAHEVNNPLATISGCAEGLQRRLNDYRKDGDLDPGDFDQYLRLIEGEAFRVKRITQSLLDFSRQQTLEPLEDVDALELIDETVELLRVGGEIDGIDVVIPESQEPITVQANPTALRQMIFNVTSNAADAIHEKREKLPAQPCGRITWTVEPREDGLEFCCKDDGIGFDPRKSGEVMEPFYTTKPPGKGTGLGLPLCHSMAERHGGTIRIRSRGAGLGADVTIFFPYQKQNRKSK